MAVNDDRIKDGGTGVAGNGSAPADTIGKVPGDNLNPQDLAGVKAKAKETRGVKPGTTRGSYKKGGPGATGAAPKPSPAAAPAASPPFNEPQVRALFQGLFNGAALVTNCNAWPLEDAEADVLVPPATVCLNNFFPQAAASKWTALTLFSVSLIGITWKKFILYRLYLMKLEKERQEEANKGAPAITPEIVK